MDRSDLQRRLGAISGAESIAVPDDFAPAVDAHVDAIAGELLHLFRQHDDPAAFTLLVEVAQGSVMVLARNVTRRLGLAIDPEDLMATFFARLFTDLRRDQPKVRRFLGFAYTAMRNEALNQLRRLKRAEGRHQVYVRMLERAGVSADPCHAASEREQVAVVQRLGAMFLSIVSECFHHLGERDRRVLLAREVDGMTYAELADALALPPGQVGMILKRARERLARRIARAFEGTPSRAAPGSVGPPGARRAVARTAPPRAAPPVTPATQPDARQSTPPTAGEADA